MIIYKFKNINKK